MSLKETTSRQDRILLINKWRNRKYGNRNIRKSSDRERLAPLSADQPRSRKNSDRPRSRKDSDASSHLSEENLPGEEKENHSEVSSIGGTSSTNYRETREKCGQIEEYRQKSPVIDDPPFDANLEYVEGDLVWAFIAGYPLWPSLVTVDPVEGVYTKIRTIGKNESRVFHVEFFGDNGSRSWLTTKVLFLFGKGTTHELKTENQSFIKHVKTKSKIFMSLQRAIKGTGRGNWQVAMTEAQKCLELSRSNRLDFLKVLVSEKLEQAQRKRKTQSLEANERKPKRQRQLKEIETILDDDDQISTGSSEKTVDEITDNETSKKKREKEKKNPEMKIEVCESCASREGRLHPCSKCKLVYHSACVVQDTVPTDVDQFLCTNCLPGAPVACFLCKQTDGEFFKCSTKLCGRSYHRHCLDSFHSPSAKQDRGPSQFVCPAHYCHTCVVQMNNKCHPQKKLLRCIKCPTAYHSSIFV